MPTLYFARSSSETFSSRARSRATSTMSCPRSASWRAKDRPIPAVAPVTRAVLMGTTLCGPHRVARCASPPGTSTPSAPASTASRPGCSAPTSTCWRSRRPRRATTSSPSTGSRRSATRWPTTGSTSGTASPSLSRVGLDDVQVGFDRHARAGATRSRPRPGRSGPPAAGVRVWSLYVPNGRTLDDPHMPYKLEWLGRLRATPQQWLADDPDLQIALMGDWNIAPHDDDVWGMAYFEGKYPRLPRRARRLPGLPRRRLRRRRPPARARARAPTPTGTTRSCASRSGRACGSTSCSAPPPSPARVAGAAIDREERKGKGASDHAPVVVELED